jgi:hypothetical protein
MILIDEVYLADMQSHPEVRLENCTGDSGRFFCAQELKSDVAGVRYMLINFGDGLPQSQSSIPECMKS